LTNQNLKKISLYKIPGSYRDPAGYVYSLENKIYRIVNKFGKNNYEFAKNNKIIEESIDNKFLVESNELSLDETPEALKGLNGSYIIEHKKIPFISYPYEWSFSQLKDAALLHLKFQIFLLNKKAALKDASAYNIQFIGKKPVFIDLLSIKPYEEGEHWLGYRQFCEQFLNPLLLKSLKGMNFNNLYRGNLEGITSNELIKFLSFKDKFSINIQLHVIWHSKLINSTINQNEKNIKKYQNIKKLSLTSYRSILEQLYRWINKLHPLKEKSAWDNYATDNTYERKQIIQKKLIVSEFCLNNKPVSIIDLGCNTGEYSEVALNNGCSYAIGYDSDINAIEKSYINSKNKNLNLLPLFADISNPSPAQGWLQSERDGFLSRSKAEAVIALAFIHHLAIGKNIPLKDIINFITSISKKGLIEFVPKDDQTVKKMLISREDIFQEYNEENFFKLLNNFVKVKNVININGSGRKIIEFSS
tara:strand:- start:191 stop:1612 length:1422 start_codon:yes stop_codon:yes gene_type:complete